MRIFIKQIDFFISLSLSAIISFSALALTKLYGLHGMPAIPGAILFIILLFLFEHYRRAENFHGEILSRQERSAKRMEALLSLHSVMKWEMPVPLMDERDLSPDLMTVVAGIILERKPSMIVQCGSGVSTLVAAGCLKKLGKGRVVALDEDERRAGGTSALISRHGLGEFAEVVDAPLAALEPEFGPGLWYRRSSLAGIEGIDMLIVDGPSGEAGSLARYPAVPVLLEKLSNDALVIADDTDREDEREIVRRWLDGPGRFSCEMIDTESGAALLARSAGGELEGHQGSGSG